MGTIKKMKYSPGEFFLDSGAFTLYSEHVKTAEDTIQGQKDKYAFFETQAFWDYVDRYAEFVKANESGMDYYASVDVIFNPELSWKSLKYLEKKHKLRPVPVLHYGTSLDWFDRHLKEGYEFIGLGGLGQAVKRADYMIWADRVFDYLCPAPKRIPIVRLHGFAMTSYRLLIRYPWWSVDSASWLKAAAFGSIYVPHKRDGKFTFEIDPYVIRMSAGSPDVIDKDHFFNLGRAERKILDEWIEFVDVPLGTVDQNGDKVEWGLISDHCARCVANLKFYEALCKWLPKWPWAFKHKPRRSLTDLVGG